MIFGQMYCTFIKNYANHLFFHELHAFARIMIKLIFKIKKSHKLVQFVAKLIFKLNRIIS
jgi:hypothetical protein